MSMAKASPDTEPNYEEHVLLSNLVLRSPVEALTLLASPTAGCAAPSSPLHRQSKSALAAVEVLTLLLRQLVDDSDPSLSPSSIAALRDTFDAIVRLRSLLETCLHGSKIAMLILADAFSVDFRDAIEQMSDALASFPWELFGSPELKDLVEIVRHLCAQKTVLVDKFDLEIRAEIVIDIEEIERDAFTDGSKVTRLFEKLEILDVNLQVNEMMALECELDARPKLETKAKGLRELINYCKFVQFPELWPAGSALYCRNPATDWIFPLEMRCPITGAVMRDPVIAISTGETYDRVNIERCLRAGQKLCSAMQDQLDENGILIPNKKIHSLIDRWADERGITLKPFQGNTSTSAASYFTAKLASSPTNEATMEILRIITARARSRAEVSVSLGEAGIVPYLLRNVTTDGDQSMLTCTLETLVALAEVEENKKVIMQAKNGSGVNMVIDVLNDGPSWEARGLASRLLYQLATVESHKWCLAREERVIVGLRRAAREGPVAVRGRAMAGLVELGSYREKLEEVRRLVRECEGGGVEDVARVLAVEPVYMLLVREERERCRAWERRKLRRKIGLLMEMCYMWLWNWDAWTRSGIFDHQPH